MGVYITRAGLPSTYQEVEYIQSSWTQRIDTWVVVKWTIGFEIDFKWLDTINSTWHAIIWGRYKGGQQELALSTYNLYTWWLVAYNTSNANAKIVKNKRQQCSLKSWVFTDCDWGMTTFTLSSFTTTANLQIFAMRDVYSSAYSDYASAALYSLKLYDWTTLVRDFVPCYRKSDNVIGMYDLVNNQFYTNSWSGTFTKWNNVYAMPLKEAYIGRWKWSPNANTVAYRPLNSTTTVNDQSWNSYNLTQTWGSFGTYNGVDCFYNGNSTAGYFDLTSWANIPTGNADRTILMWAYPTGYNSSYSRYFIDYGGSSAGTAVYVDINTSWKPYASIYSTGITGSNAMSTSSWSLLTFTSTGNTFNFYVNWASIWSSSWTINTTAISSSYPLRLMRQNTASSSNYQVRGYISEVIIENKTRTADEIANYYNQTKANYWIS